MWRHLPRMPVPTSPWRGNRAVYAVGSPPPCGEGLGVGSFVQWPKDPLPNPPSQGGRERTARAASDALASPNNGNVKATSYEIPENA